jgi:hypothetical protein
MAHNVTSKNAPFAFGGSQAWNPEYADNVEDDPFNDSADSVDVHSLLWELHRPAADAYADAFLTGEDRRFWK